MKKILLLSFALALATGIQAQRGRSGLGIGAGYYSQEDDYRFGAAAISLKYQYGISNVFEIEPSATFYVSGEIVDNYDAYGYDARRYVTSDYSVNYSLGLTLHTYLMKTRFRPYLITGLFAHGVSWPEFSYTEDDYYSNGRLVRGAKQSFGGGSAVKAAARLGLGLDYRLFYHSNLQFEACYDTYSEGAYAGLNYVYKF